MTLRDDLLAERDRIDQRLAIIDRAGEDLFPIGTVVLFSSASSKYYYLKTGEEAWRNMFGSTETKELRQWILLAEDNLGYFEIYVLTPDPTPFYTSMTL